MPTYNVHFRTDADYAIRQFTARSSKDALRRARSFYERRP